MASQGAGIPNRFQDLDEALGVVFADSADRADRATRTPQYAEYLRTFLREVFGDRPPDFSSPEVRGAAIDSLIIRFQAVEESFRLLAPEHHRETIYQAGTEFLQTTLYGQRRQPPKSSAVSKQVHVSSHTRRPAQGAKRHAEATKDDNKDIQDKQDEHDNNEGERDAGGFNDAGGRGEEGTGAEQDDTDVGAGTMDNDDDDHSGSTLLKEQAAAKTPLRIQRGRQLGSPFGTPRTLTPGKSPDQLAVVIRELEADGTLSGLKPRGPKEVPIYVHVTRALTEDSSLRRINANLLALRSIVLPEAAIPDNAPDVIKEVQGRYTMLQLYRQYAALNNATHFHNMAFLWHSLDRARSAFLEGHGEVFDFIEGEIRKGDQGAISSMARRAQFNEWVIHRLYNVRKTSGTMQLYNSANRSLDYDVWRCGHAAWKIIECFGNDGGGLLFLLSQPKGFKRWLHDWGPSHVATFIAALYKRLPDLARLTRELGRSLVLPLLSKGSSQANLELEIAQQHFDPDRYSSIAEMFQAPPTSLAIALRPLPDSAPTGIGEQAMDWETSAEEEET